MARSFVIGDIHGAYTALLQCLERAEFDNDADRLICLGDVCDRRIQVKECVDELLKIKNLLMIRGNHDQWALDWMLTGNRPDVWLMQGGRQTTESYRSGVPASHLDFFQRSLYYYIDQDRLFVHGGINHELPIRVQLPDIFLWDRSLVSRALEVDDPAQKLSEFEEIYVGHTPTIRILAGRPNKEKGISQKSRQAPNRRTADPSIRRSVEPSFDSAQGPSGSNVTKDLDSARSDCQTDEPTNRPPDFPVRLCNVWLMDTGAGWPGGRLSMMDTGSKELFQSDVLE